MTFHSKATRCCCGDTSVIGTATAAAALLTRNVDGSAENIARLGYHPGPSPLIGEVGDDGSDPCSVLLAGHLCLAQAAGQLIVLVERTGDQGDVGTLGRETLRDARADTAARAGDNGPASVEWRRR